MRGSGCSLRLGGTPKRQPVHIGTGQAGCSPKQQWRLRRLRQPFAGSSRRQQDTSAVQGMSEPHSAQHAPAKGGMNMLASQQAELPPDSLQVVNHGTSTSLNATPVTKHAETHKIDADFFTMLAKLWCPANISRTNQPNWLALASSSLGELLPAVDISACCWCAAGVRHLFGPKHPSVGYWESLCQEP